VSKQDKRYSVQQRNDARAQGERRSCVEQSRPSARKLVSSHPATASVSITILFIYIL